MARGKNMILKIQEEYNCLFIDILNKEYSCGLRNCDIAVKYGIAQATINHYLNKIKELSPPDLYGKISSPPRYLNKQRREEIEGEYLMPFKDVLIYLRYIEELSPSQMGKLLNCSSNTIYDWMKKYNIVMSKPEAMKQAVKTGRMDFGKVHKKRRQGYARLYARGSSTEEYIRLYIKNFFENNLPDNYDYIIGFTNWSILNSKETDIPIVIINNNNNKLFKFAIEYDNSKYHTKTINLNKKVISEIKNWKFFNLYDDNNNKNDLNFKIDFINKKILKELELKI